MRLAYLAHATIALTCIVASGCSTDRGVPTVPVSGVVTFDGGTCPAAGHVNFAPIEVANGLPRRPASGQFDADGSYSATSYEPGDGLVPGRYQVLISCFDGVPDSMSPTGFQDASFVAADYQPEELVVPADGGPVVANFDVRMNPKKKK